MNRHIEEIVEIANGLALAEFNNVSLRKFRLYSEIYQEKFAELIVRECARQVDWILAEGGKTQGDLIKEHFGVE